MFDYKDPEASAKIRKWAEPYGGLTVALDTISEQGSTKLVAESLGPQGGKIITLCAYLVASYRFHCWR